MSTTRHTPGSFCWFECGTTDAAKAKRFYTGLFGWNAEDHAMPGEMGGEYTILKLGGADIAGLYQMSGPQFAGVPPHWMTYVTVEDVDQSAELGRTLGARVVAPPMDVPGVGRMAFLQDPTGAHFAIFRPGEHAGAAQLGAAPGAFCWSELATGDTTAAQSFYTKLFPWSAKPSEDPSMPYTEFQLGGQSIAGLMALTEKHGDAPPHWLPYVSVADCEATARKVTELGGSLIVPPMHIPDVGDFTVFQDPTGAVLAVVQLGA